MKFITIVGLTSMFVMTACTTPVTAVSGKVSHETKTFVETSHKTGEVVSVIVGNPIIEVKRSTGTFKTMPGMVSDTSFTFTHPKGRRISYTKGTKLAIYGQATVATKLCKLLNVENNKFVVDPSNGYLLTSLGVIASDNGAIFVEGFEINPKEVIFNDTEVTLPVAATKDTGYELIYSGRMGGTLNFLYREYTGEGIARTAFNQNISYDSATRMIEFKELKLEILEIGPSSITLKIIHSN